MRAIVVSEPGGPSALAYAQAPDPVPGPGEVLVDVAAAGVNFIDVYHREGRYPLPIPFTPGQEGAGTVTAVGPEVTGVAVGDRVGWGDVGGSYADKAVIPAGRAIPIPDEVALDTAAAVFLQGLTAHYLTRSTYAVQPGDDVLVHAAAGGMGLLLTQTVKLLGGRVIGTVSTAEKEKLARDAGADEVLRYEDFAEAVRDLTGGRGVRVVYDGVGAATFEGSLEALGIRGTLALYGAASGPVPPFDPQRLNKAGSLFLTRPTLAHHIHTREELLERAADVLGAVASGALNIHISRRYPLAEARTAHEDLQARRTTGKLLLVP
ncbi:quinone oxidoreductase [Sphaerisporangium sp. TRM90804]|uniref:quinone oxidoreductase family protein n=1 Tax=Sphaerisporangium sp. TRM90804 TaxID=3031113 RepID=UPI00244D2F2F|nr:quinone oxidoreductase [Sphaerisporangium sp. TRM90804]MDH2429701.1 quinone oxidoreductase [Sphaerisporangium sp. TRM90804]